MRRLPSIVELIGVRRIELADEAMEITVYAWVPLQKELPLLAIGLSSYDDAGNSITYRFVIYRRHVCFERTGIVGRKRNRYTS